MTLAENAWMKLDNKATLVSVPEWYLAELDGWSVELGEGWKNVRSGKPGEEGKFLR